MIEKKSSNLVLDIKTSAPHLYQQSVKPIYNSPLFEPTMKDDYIETSILKLKFRKKIDPSLLNKNQSYL